MRDEVVPSHLNELDVVVLVMLSACFTQFDHEASDTSNQTEELSSVRSTIRTVSRIVWSSSGQHSPCFLKDVSNELQDLEKTNSITICNLMQLQVVETLLQKVAPSALF